ncbi:hypothetical protein [Candidatus Aeolococcus gillhamiae]
MTRVAVLGDTHLPRRSMPTFTMAVMIRTAGRAHAEIVDLGRGRA